MLCEMYSIKPDGVTVSQQSVTSCIPTTFHLLFIHTSLLTNHDRREQEVLRAISPHRLSAHDQNQAKVYMIALM